MADTADFEKIALPHLKAVYRAAYALCGQVNRSEDLVQTTFLKAFERFGSYRPGSNCRAWLLRILRNTWIDQLRHRKVVGPTVSVEETLLAQPDAPQETKWSNAEDILENFSDAQVIRALARLPEDQRLTLYLTDVEELSQDEIAQITGVAVGTVKSRASRARRMLKDVLEEHARELGLTGRRNTDALDE